MALLLSKASSENWMSEVLDHADDLLECRAETHVHRDDFAEYESLLRFF